MVEIGGRMAKMAKKVGPGLWLYYQEVEKNRQD
jgi:hypothetical protein